MNLDGFHRITVTRQIECIRAQVLYKKAEAQAQNHPNIGQTPALFMIGSSMGGFLALLYQALYGDISQIILMAPAFGFVENINRYFSVQDLASWEKTGYLPVFHTGFNRGERLSYQYYQDFQKYIPIPLKIDIPCLIFHGTLDSLIDYRLSQAFAENNPKVQFFELSSDHHLMNCLDFIWEQMAEFFKLPADEPT